MTHRKLQKISPVPRKEWPRVITHFNQINHGRMIRVERYGANIRHEHMEESLPLFSLNYDADKGDILTIAVGQDRAEQEFRVEGPKEVWVESGAVEKGEAMEIVDKDERHVVISLE